MTNEQFKQIFPSLIKNYQPAADAVARIKNVSLLMVIGPSGVGKTTLMKKLDIPLIAGDTSRPIRPEETEGVDYHFRTDYQQIIQEIKDSRFLQVAVGPAGDFYASDSQSYPSEGFCVGAVVADAVPLFRQLGFAQTISAFIVPPSYDEWMHRMGSHELGDEQLTKRLDEAKRSLAFAISDSQTHFILNDEVTAATAQLEKLISGQVDSVRESIARGVAQDNLARLNQVSYA